MIFTYKTTNLINGKIYIGVHKTRKNKLDSYLGSGIVLHRAIKKYGAENFKREIINFHETLEQAYEEEHAIVDADFVNRSDTYNQNIGGDGGWYHTKGMTSVYDENGNIIMVSIADPKFIDRTYTSIHKNMLAAKDSNGNIEYISKDDPRYLSGELVGHMKGKVSVRDSYGNIFSVSVDDPRYLSGELVGVTKGLVPVKDKNGNCELVDKQDPRYLSGELVHISVGNTFIIDNPKQLTCSHCGKIGRSSNMKRWHFDKCKQNPNRIEYDSLTCPHCGKIGTKANMKRWHFDNCKLR